MSENILSPYSTEQLGQEGVLPERIASISHDAQVAEGQRLTHMLTLTTEVTNAVKEKTQRPFVLRGSVAMYALLNDLKSHNQVQNLMMLEQRIAGGKNDFDVAFNPDEVEGAMNDFGWNEQEKANRRSVFGLAHGKAMVDISGRVQLPSFPWVHVDVNGVSVLVVNPMEGILERMSILSDSETPDKQIKWGVDVRILKAYLIVKNSWSEEQLEAELSKSWDKYQDDIRYQGVQGIVKRHQTGESASSIVESFIGSQKASNDLSLEDRLRRLFPAISEDMINNLLNPNSLEVFESTVKSVIDLTAKPKMDYATMSSQASVNYSNLLSQSGTKL